MGNALCDGEKRFLRVRDSAQTIALYDMHTFGNFFLVVTINVIFATHGGRTRTTSSAATRRNQPLWYTPNNNGNLHV